MVSLDLDNPSPAYRCGRLLAVLEAAQRAANPGINQTVVDRFYASASTTPALAFPRLLQLSQHHLSKLRRTWPAAHHALQQRLEQVMAGLREEFPSTLALYAQGLFALGYYHQRAHDRAQAQERRKAGLEPADEEEENQG